MTGEAEHYPGDRRYHPEHGWLRVVDTVRVDCGVTWYAQEQLGEIIYVGLPAVGERLRAGEPYGEIESLKTVSRPDRPGVRHRARGQRGSRPGGQELSTTIRTATAG